jgi:hypothetical protein
MDGWKKDVIIKQFPEARCHRKKKELKLPWGGRTWKPLDQVASGKCAKVVTWSFSSLHPLCKFSSISQWNVEIFIEYGWKVDIKTFAYYGW